LGPSRLFLTAPFWSLQEQGVKVSQGCLAREIFESMQSEIDFFLGSKAWLELRQQSVYLF